MWHHYDISFSNLGRDIHSKVYLLLESFLNIKLIVKIYEKERHQFYEKEKEILEILNNKLKNNENRINFFPMYKNIIYSPNMFTIPEEIRDNNLEFLFFDYLPNLSLSDYLIDDYIIDLKKEIKEIHAKYLCYKLLMIIKNLHESNICHNAIDTSNILFDENYDPKLIHFSEANIIEKKTSLNKDFFKLGQTLAKIISLGKIESIVYNKKEKALKFKLFKQNKLEDESKFWEKLKITDDIDISGQFINFFHLLINSKISNNLIEIEEIMKNEWLNEVNNNLVISQKNFENDFKIMNDKIIGNRNLENKIEVDINNIININKKEDNNLKYYNFDYYKNEIQNQQNPFINNYNSMNNIATNLNNMMMMDNNIFNNINLTNNNNMNFNNNNIMMANNDNEAYLSGNQLMMIKDNMNINKINNYNLNYFNKINQFQKGLTENNFNKKTKKNDYNIFELNIKNIDKTEQEIKNALIFFMQTFRRQLITKFHILVDSVNEKNISFNINGFIFPYNYDDYDEIIFLDEKFEQIAKFGLKYQIKVKLLKKFVYKYYMVFEGINIDKEYFFRYIKDFKDIAKALLKSKYNNNNYLFK